MSEVRSRSLHRTGSLFGEKFVNNFHFKVQTSHVLCAQEIAGSSMGSQESFRRQSTRICTFRSINIHCYCNKQSAFLLRSDDINKTDHFCLIFDNKSPNVHEVVKGAKLFAFEASEEAAENHRNFGVNHNCMQNYV